MRTIKEAILHYSATPEGKPFDVKDIWEWHVNGNGWSDVGYHYVIKLDGTIQDGRPIKRTGAHCRGHNRGTVGICYIGGGLTEGKDTRTEEQKDALVILLNDLIKQYNITKISGHNQYSTKKCPGFDVPSEYSHLI
jgi:N-acetylmuramoyl-L-alanine amidase|tara:strand:+ start:270 stop:677 length:408 start_codon:yes stop_codon:yes gene_type:complete